MPKPETYEDKQRLYQAGQYAIPAPAVCHANYGEREWIALIDAHGTWLEPMDVAMQNARNHQRDWCELKH